MRLVGGRRKRAGDQEKRERAAIWSIHAPSMHLPSVGRSIPRSLDRIRQPPPWFILIAQKKVVTKERMRMTPRLRKLILVTHVMTSVAGIGAVCGFLALAVMGLTTANDYAARSAYVSMEVIAWSVILPLILASLVSGLVQSLGSEWGIFRHYWILAKLGINVFATIILLLHMRPIAALARAAESAVTFGDGLSKLQVQLMANALAALFVLVIATALSIYKPRGLTPYGARVLARAPALPDARKAIPPWVRASALFLGICLLAFVAIHLAGLGLGAH